MVWNKTRSGSFLCVGISLFTMLLVNAAANASDPFAVDELQWSTPDGHKIEPPKIEVATPPADNKPSTAPLIQAPLLPGLTTRRDDAHTSAADEETVTPGIKIMEKEKQPPLKLPDQQWKTTHDAVKENPALASRDKKPATPLRPIDVPMLPGIVNNGLDVHVSSTDDDNSISNQPVVDWSEGQSTLKLPDKRWKTTIEYGQRKNPGEEDDEDAKLDVRMTYLPSKLVSPTLPDEVAHTKGRPKINEPEKKTKEAKANDQAACNAVDQFKQKQLQAIQGDRATLQALKAAISDLGLQKKLDFITGMDNSLVADDQKDKPNLAGQASPMK